MKRHRGAQVHILRPRRHCAGMVSPNDVVGDALPAVDLTTWQRSYMSRQVTMPSALLRNHVLIRNGDLASLATYLSAKKVSVAAHLHVTTSYSRQHMLLVVEKELLDNARSMTQAAIWLSNIRHVMTPIQPSRTASHEPPKHTPHPRRDLSIWPTQPLPYATTGTHKAPLVMMKLRRCCGVPTDALVAIRTSSDCGRRVVASSVIYTNPPPP